MPSNNTDILNKDGWLWYFSGITSSLLSAYLWQSRKKCTAVSSAFIITNKYKYGSWTASRGDPWTLDRVTSATHGPCHEAIRGPCHKETHGPCHCQYRLVHSAVKLQLITGRPLLVSHVQVVEPICISSPSLTTEPSGTRQLGPEKSEWPEVRARKYGV